MSYQSKLEAAHQELKEKGVWKFTYDPPILRICRGLGIKVIPFHYQGFVKNAIIYFFIMLVIATCFGIAAGLHVSWGASFFTRMMLVEGAVGGILSASFYYIRKKQLSLTDWDDLP
ncbi:hypothetical protein HCU01_06650 [Halomonas cupida]|uniref:Uncharacterized protein n=1 Tax=Halomonas cupida TaxID=44933 RepID=A0A1M6ZMV7_9GAMM|nr:DUF6404 family protein [Halomonas cupida]GEN22716.1 hypothetical protein HCU01_06650 [Halomonas cupida]SHL31655.1 hypothetical protein SAMN05660971_00174 [Halomonas cupida]